MRPALSQAIKVPRRVFDARSTPMVGILIFRKAIIFAQLYVLRQRHTKSSSTFQKSVILKVCEIIARVTRTTNLPANDRFFAVLVMLATLVVIVANFLAATGHINGVRPNEISDRYPTVITPAGWAFSIWSLIYLGLIAFSIYQLLPARIAEFGRLRLPYIVSCILNCTWIIFWHHFHTGVCTVVIALLLASLFWVNARLAPPTTFGESILARGVFGLYAGWVTVATLVNLLLYLVSEGIDLDRSSWNLIGIVCLVLALLAAVAARIVLRNFIYPLPIAWAAAAIGANQSGNTPIVVAAAIVCIGCLIISGTVVTELKGSTA